MNDAERVEGREARRREILASAVEVFARHGFADARIRDIAARAGIAEGTIYLYFQGKDDLLLTAFRDTVSDFCRSIQSVLEADLPFIDRLESFIRLQFERIEAEPALAAVLLLESRQTSKFYGPPVREVLREYAAAIDDLLASGVGDGSIRPDVSLPIARRILIGSLEEIELEWLIGDRSRSLVATAAPLAETFFRGLAVR